MSDFAIIETTRAACEDPSNGLAARMSAIAAKRGVLSMLRIKLWFQPWLLTGSQRPGFAANVSVAPFRSLAEVRDVDAQPIQRDAAATIQIGYEFFSADEKEIASNVLITAAALLQVLDSLPDYSEANGGTIQGIYGQPSFEYGPFSNGKAASAGFLCTVTILERGSE